MHTTYCFHLGRTHRINQPQIFYSAIQVHSLHVVQDECTVGLSKQAVASEPVLFAVFFISRESIGLRERWILVFLSGVSVYWMPRLKLPTTTTTTMSFPSLFIEFTFNCLAPFGKRQPVAFVVLLYNAREASVRLWLRTASSSLGVC